VRALELSVADWVHSPSVASVSQPGDPSLECVCQLLKKRVVAECRTALRRTADHLADLCALVTPHTAR
jgi:hypothetical protein